MSLKKYLEVRISQQERRVHLIPKYNCENDFSVEDVVKIKEDIEECKVALKALEDHEIFKEVKSKNIFKQALL